MKALRVLLLITILISSTITSFSQTFTNACYVAATGRVWEATGGCGYYVLVCDGSDYEYATITSALGPVCTPCSGSGSGRRVTINVIPCDIDNYVWLLITGISCTFFLKRRFLFNN